MPVSEDLSIVYLSFNTIGHNAIGWLVIINGHINVKSNSETGHKVDTGKVGLGWYKKVDPFVLNKRLQRF